MLSNNNQTPKINPTIITTTNQSVKLKNVSRKSQQPSLPGKKACLSLSDYYRRKGIDIPDNSHLNDSSDSATDSADNVDELTSALGISFMDSFAVKPVVKQKPKSSKPLRIGDVCSLTSTESIIRRCHIVRKPPRPEPVSHDIVSYESPLDATTRIQTSSRMWLPKPQPQTHYPTFIPGQQPPSLLKICQDVLFIYRVHIEEVLLTPRELLATVLEAYTVDQLRTFESFNEVRRSIGLIVNNVVPCSTTSRTMTSCGSGTSSPSCPRVSLN